MMNRPIGNQIWLLSLALVVVVLVSFSTILVNGQEATVTESSTLVPLVEEASKTATNPAPSETPPAENSSAPAEVPAVDGAAAPATEAPNVEPVILKDSPPADIPSDGNTPKESSKDDLPSKSGTDGNDVNNEDERVPKVYIIHHHGADHNLGGHFQPNPIPSPNNNNNFFPPIFRPQQPSRPSYFPQYPPQQQQQPSHFGGNHPFLNQPTFHQRDPSIYQLPSSPFNRGNWNPQLIPRRPTFNQQPPLPPPSTSQHHQPAASPFDPLGQFDEGQKKRQFYQDMLVTQLNYFHDKIEPMAEREENITKKNDMEELLMSVQDLKQTLEAHQIFNISEIMDNWKRGKLNPIDEERESESESEPTPNESEGQNEPKPTEEDTPKSAEDESTSESSPSDRVQKPKNRPTLIHRRVIIVPQSSESQTPNIPTTSSMLSPSQLPQFQQQERPNPMYGAIFRQQQAQQYSNPYGQQQGGAPFVGFSSIGQHRTGLGGAGYGGLSFQPQMVPERRESDNYMRKLIGYY